MYEPVVRTVAVSDLDVLDGVGEGALTLALLVSFLPTSGGVADEGNEYTTSGCDSTGSRVPILPGTNSTGSYRVLLLYTTVRLSYRSHLQRPRRSYLASSIAVTNYHLLVYRSPSPSGLQ